MLVDARNATLPAVPVADLQVGSLPAREAPFWTAANALVEDLESRVGRRRIAALDAISRAWLTYSRSPYVGELDAIAQRLERPGAYLLNLSYEWAACSVGVHADATGGVQMIRAFDWAMDGIGRHTFAMLRSGPSGPWAGLSWPLFVGEVTVFAPERFAIALNLAPPRPWYVTGQRLWGPLEVGLNLLDRAATRRLPPAHLLRLVAERAQSAREATRLLAETPIARSAIFVVAGLDPSETCVVERLPTRAEVRHVSFAANHFARPDWPGIPLDDSFERAEAIAREPGAPFEWCRPPVCNERTRNVAEMNARKSYFDALAMEAHGPVTRPTRVTVPRNGRVLGSTP